MGAEVTTEDRAVSWPSGIVTGLVAEPGDPSFDPVLLTARDRPEVSSIPPPLDPVADHLAPEVTRRRAQVDEAHRRVVALLDDGDYDGALLTRADSLAWFTAGADLGTTLVGEAGAVALFVIRGTRAVLVDNIRSARVFEEELGGLGFQLKERPWQIDEGRVVAELSRNKRIATDAGGYHDLISAADLLQAIRSPLTEPERDHLRGLGRALTLAVEATCRTILPGETEAEVVGQLAHRLLREGIGPIDLRVAADGRLARYREPSSKGVPIRHHATILAVGRRHGLCAGLTRTVAFGTLAEAFQADLLIATMVDATSIYFSRPGEPVAEVLRRSQRIFEKMDRPHEWTLDDAGCRVGYRPDEGRLVADRGEVLRAGQALRWSPSVGAARSEDTIVIDEQGFEVVTAMQDWPRLTISVKGFTIDRPGVLVRPAIG